MRCSTCRMEASWSVASGPATASTQRRSPSARWRVASRRCLSRRPNASFTWRVAQASPRRTQRRKGHSSPALASLVRQPGSSCRQQSSGCAGGLGSGRSALASKRHGLVVAGAGSGAGAGAGAAEDEAAAVDAAEDACDPDWRRPMSGVGEGSLDGAAAGVAAGRPLAFSAGRGGGHGCLATSLLAMSVSLLLAIAAFMEATTALFSCAVDAATSPVLPMRLLCGCFCGDSSCATLGGRLALKRAERRSFTSAIASLPFSPQGGCHSLSPPQGRWQW
mmetsp:Transcript_46024/g.144217  ORF Transcript_46024/g.144217 Transcript_46024/m.144217 type:complete len:277 (+) Transcript_46024:2010-2840(+)